MGVEIERPSSGYPFVLFATSPICIGTILPREWLVDAVCGPLPTREEAVSSLTARTLTPSEEGEGTDRQNQRRPPAPLPTYSPV